MGMAYSLGRVALCEDGRVNDYVSVNLANWNSRVPITWTDTTSHRFLGILTSSLTWFDLIESDSVR